jgi:hypothetical protein
MAGVEWTFPAVCRDVVDRILGYIGHLSLGP